MPGKTSYSAVRRNYFLAVPRMYLLHAAKTVQILMWRRGDMLCNESFITVSLM